MSGQSAWLPPRPSNAVGAAEKRQTPLVVVYPRSAAMKRAFDLVVVLLAALAWVPVLSTVALLVLVFEGRPVFYVSTRQVGPGRFEPIMKLRTMKRDADKYLNRDTVPIQGTRFLNIPRDSPAYTPIGRLIERLALTELPQLLHVVSGRMSLVGARPLPRRVMDELKALNPSAEDRFITPPGLTGPVQMIGRDRLSDADRLALEQEYCRLAAGPSYTVLLDLWLLAATVILVIYPRWLMTVPFVRSCMRRLASKTDAEPAAAPSPRTTGAD